MYDELIKNLRGMAKGFCAFDRNNPMCGYFVTQQAADAIEELLAEREENYADSWIPVTERLPEDGAEVLAFNKTGFAYVDYWTNGKWKINSMVDEEHEIVTHWMPLPQPPKEG